MRLQLAIAQYVRLHQLHQSTVRGEEEEEEGEEEEGEGVRKSVITRQQSNLYLFLTPVNILSLSVLPDIFTSTTSNYLIKCYPVTQTSGA